MTDTSETTDDTVPDGDNASAPEPDRTVLYLDGKPYEVPSDPYDIPVAHLNAVERHTGMTVGEWGEKLADPTVSLLAITALAWVAKRMAGEFVKWHEFEQDLSTGELLDAMKAPPVDVQVPVPNRADRRRAART